MKHKIFSLVLLGLLCSIGNMWGAPTSTHTPGIYEKSTEQGGYGQTLKTSSSRKYEVYGFSSTGSSANYVWAGSTTTTSTDAHCVLSFATTTEQTNGWISNYVNGRGSSYSNLSSSAEFTGIGGYQMNYRSNSKLTIKVSGYDQFSICAKDANTSDKYFVVKVDGTEKEMTYSSASTPTIRRFDITTGEHTIEVTATGNSNCVLWGFSLRLPDTYTVTYDANGATGGSVPTDAKTYKDNDNEVTVLGNTGGLEKTGYTFAGWNTKADGSGDNYEAGNTFDITASTTLYAKWTVKTYTITLHDNNGEEANGSATATYNSNKLTSITEPTWAGKAVVGYYKEAGMSNLIADAEGNLESSTDYTDASGNWTHNDDVTLFAKWEALAAPTAMTITGAGSYAKNAEATLTVTEVDGVPVPTIKWYSSNADGSELSEDPVETGTTYSPSTATAGKFYFVAKATNSQSTFTSDVQTITVKPATPTITKGDFNFANKGYAVTLTNNEATGDLKIKIGSADWANYAAAIYATTTTSYQAKVVVNGAESDVVSLGVTNTFDGEKKYIAWVYDVTNYSGYKTSEDAIYTALASEYNMVPLGYSASTTLWNEGVNDIKNADLLVSTEAVKGSVALGNDLKNFIGALPMVNMKMFHYTTSGRWGWGAPANSTKATITPSNTLYKVLNGTAVSDGKVTLFSGGTNKVQSVGWGSAPANNVNMATDADGSKIAMHAIIDDGHLDKQFFGIGLSCDDKAYYTADAITVVKNAIAIMLAGEERLDAEVSSVSGTISSTGWSTFSSTYPLDLSSISGGAAYVATSTAADLVTLTPTSAKVASGEGVMIKGTAGYSFTISTTSDAADLAGTNLLVGCPAATVLSTNDNHYVMVSNGGEAEFQSLVDNGATIPAGKAYLDLTKLGGGAPDRMRIVEAENNATNIENVEGNETAVKFIENGQIYIKRDGVVYDTVGRVIRK